MNIIIFNSQVGGHYLEYVHHLYESAIDDKRNNYIFILPQSFESVKNKWEWESSSNIQFDLFINEKITSQTPSFSSQLAYSFNLYKKLRNDIRKYNAQSLLVLSLTDFTLVAILFAKKKIAINGIIYRLYTREEKKGLSYKLDVLKCFIIGKLSVFKNIFILNDKITTRYLNQKFRTEKFKYLSDPYLPIMCSGKDFRQENSIESSDVVFAHIGSLSYNKGTIEVLNSLRLLSADKRNKYTFVFAGKIVNEIRSEFYSIFDDVKEKCRIIVYDEFCSYEFLADICKASDALVIPYRRTAQSSGIIGYASQFGIPVISINKGLLGSIIRSYSLGLLIEDGTGQSLINAYQKIENKEFDKPSKEYCECNTIDMFQSTILNNLF